MGIILVVEEKPGGRPRPCAMVHPARELGGLSSPTQTAKGGMARHMAGWRNACFGATTACGVAVRCFQLDFEASRGRNAQVQLGVKGAFPNVRRGAAQQALHSLLGAHLYGFFAGGLTHAVGSPQ